MDAGRWTRIASLLLATLASLVGIGCQGPPTPRPVGPDHPASPRAAPSAWMPAPDELESPVGFEAAPAMEHGDHHAPAEAADGAHDGRDGHDEHGEMGR